MFVVWFWVNKNAGKLFCLRVVFLPGLARVHGGVATKISPLALQE